MQSFKLVKLPPGFKMAEVESLAAADSNSAVVRKLGSCVLLSEKEIEFVTSLLVNRVSFDVGETLVEDGAEMRYCIALLSGTTARHRITPSGRRQILDFAIAGDMIGTAINYDNRSFSTLSAVTNTEVALIEPIRLMEAARDFPILSIGFQWNLIQKFHILSEHNVNLGAKTAKESLLQLLLELWCRFMTIGEATMDGYVLPLTQTQLGEACGLTNVYVSRMMKELQQEGLIAIDGKTVSFPDFAKAFRFADFDMSFLQPIPLREGVFPQLVEMIDNS